MPLRPLRASEVVRKLERAGFRFRRHKGSHARYVHADERGITVPVHPGDVPIPIIRSILHQASLTTDECEAL